jgi:hypothetical protein
MLLPAKNEKRSAADTDSADRLDRQNSDPHGNRTLESLVLGVENGVPLCERGERLGRDLDIRSFREKRLELLLDARHRRTSSSSFLAVSTIMRRN